MSEFIGSYENQVLDAIDIVVQAAIQSAGYDRTISATIMECLDSERGLYKVRYQDAIYTASAEDPSKKYSQNSQVYVLIPENDYSKHKRIIGTASELGEDYAATITENPYKILGGNCALMPEELSFSSYKGTDEYVLYSSKENATNSISIDKETFLSYVKDASRIKIGMDFKTFILKAQEGGVYGLQIIFTEKNIENQNTPLRKLVSITNFDMIGHPYCSLDWGFQSIEFEINPERFIEIEEIKFFLQGFKEDKDKEEIPDIYIKDFFLAGLAHQDSTTLNTYYLDIIAPANRAFTEGKDTLEMTADLSFRGETVISTPPVEYYWFRENATVKVESIPVDQKPLYHIYAGEGWECLNPYTFVTEEVEVNGVKETKITGGNWGSLTTYSISSQSLKKVRYRCIAYFKDKVVGIKDIEITNNNPKYDLELISSDGNFNFYDNLGSKKLTLKLNKVEEENKNFEVEWGTLDSSKLYSAIETIKVEDNQSSLTIYGRDINIEKRYFATLFKVEEEKKELIGTVSANVTNEILPKESTYSVRIKNGEQVFIYDEGGYAPNHSSKISPQVIVPLEFSLFDPDGKEIEVGEDFEIDVQWRLPQEETLLTDTGSDNTTLTYSFGIAGTYSKDKTNNTIVLEVLYKDKICKDYTNFTFLKDGNSGTNGTGAFGKISFATDLNGEYPLLLQTSNDDFILNGNNIDTNNSQLAVSIWNNGIETPSEKIKKVIWRLNTIGGNSNHQSYYTVDTGAIVLTGNDFTYLSNENIEKNHYIFSIVQAEVEYEDTASTRRKLFTEMPICLARSYQEGYSIRMKKGSGFNEVLYINDGTSPQYASNPFEVEVLYNGTIFSDTRLSYKWRADGVKKNLIKLTDKNSNIEDHSVDSLTRYDGLSLDLGITVIAYLEEAPIATLFFPINFLINRYGYAALNDWDGHSIQINEQDGYILTPQAGAGSKDEDNSFTGILMGEVKPTGSETESGLFGYNKGKRTIFLDARSGKATFGKTGAGQIILDPESGKAQIYSYEYYGKTNGAIDFEKPNPQKKGMLIDFTTPKIEFGSGAFSVSPEGKLTARGADIRGPISASSVNLYGNGYSDFEQIPPLKEVKKNDGTPEGTTVSTLNEIYYMGYHINNGVDITESVKHSGYRCLKVANNNTTTNLNTTFLLGCKERNYGKINIQPRTGGENGVYIISAWVRCKSSSKPAVMRLLIGESDKGGSSDAIDFNREIGADFTVTKTSWERVSFEYIADFRDSSYYIALAVSNKTPGSEIYVDDIQIEAGWPNQKPSDFHPAGVTKIDGGTITTETITALGRVTAGEFYIYNSSKGTVFSVDGDGYLYAKKAYFDGHIESGSGKIANWEIGTNEIKSQATVASAVDTEGKSYKPWTRIGNTSYKNVIVVGAKELNDTEIPNAPFRVTRDGVLYATGADITGTINATNGSFSGELKSVTGNIGGWKLDTYRLCSFTNADGDIKDTKDKATRWVQLASYGANNAIYVAKRSSTSDTTWDTQFSVSFAGAMTAKSGTIGGWTIEPTRLFSRNDADTRFVGLYSHDHEGFTEDKVVYKYAIRVLKKDTDDGSYKKMFTVKYNGEVYARNATIDGDSTFGGELKAASGTFTGTLSAASGSFTSLTAGGDTSSTNIKIIGNKGADNYIKIGKCYFYPEKIKLDAGKDTIASLIVSGPGIDGWEDITLRPSLNNKGNIGTNKHYWNLIRVTNYPGSSERYLKENIQTYNTEQAYEELKDIPFYSYKFIDENNTRLKIGTMIDYMPSETIFNDESINRRSYDMQNLIFWDIAATQVIQQKLEETIQEKEILQNRLDILEQKFLEMEEKLNGFN